jgi:uncharacterized protein (DUF1330 family)
MGRNIMKARHVAASSALIGIALGAVAIQGLHAQAKPPAYVVVAIQSITDAAGLRTVAEKAAPGALAAAGGRYLIRTNDVTGFNGTPPKRFVVIAFDSVERAQAWRDSPAQKEIEAIRLKSTESVSFMVEGTAN